MLNSAKRQIKTQYKSEGDLDVSQIEDFYKALKKSHQFFFFLTNKENDSLHLKFQTQKILYYLIQILMRNEATGYENVSKENVLKVVAKSYLIPTLFT